MSRKTWRKPNKPRGIPDLIGRVNPPRHWTMMWSHQQYRDRSLGQWAWIENERRENFWKHHGC